MIFNKVDGQARGVVQAEKVVGGVHFYAPDSPAATPPAQVPNPPRVYTNNGPLLDEITKALHFEDDAPDQAPRLVVIVGPIGGGKTSLACQWSHEHREKFPDGAFFAPMAEFRRRDRASCPDLGESEGAGAESECLLQFLQEIGFAPAEIPQTLSGRRSLFRTWSTGKRVLVVVDGPARGSQVRSLQPGAGRSAVVVAGPLVPGDLRMDQPAFVEIEPLTWESATELVRRILPAGDPRPEQEPEQLDELIAMCRDHTIALCVAAELLADRPKRPIARLVEQLSREKRRLKALSPDSTRSVPAVFGAAVERLDERTQRVYAAFGKHPGHGDIGVEAVAAVLDEDPDEVQDSLDQLASARLIQEGDPDRYFALGLVRDHARQVAEDDQLSTRFVRWYVDRAIGAGQALMPQRGWLERLWPELDLTSNVEEPEAWFETERANLRATAEVLAESEDERLLPLAVALWPFHERTKHVDDMDRVNELAADLARRVGNLFAAGLALVQRGFAFRHRGEHDKGAELFAEAERIAVEHGPRDLEATAAESLGVIRREQGDPMAARELLRRNLAMAREIENPRRTALAQMHLGSVETAAEAVAMLDQAVETFRGLSTPDVHNEHKTLMWRGIRHIELGNVEQAAQDLTAALQRMTAEKRLFEMAQTCAALGELAVTAGAPEQARENFEQAVSLYRAWGFPGRAEQVQVELDAL